jgi:hypothetical protein
MTPADIARRLGKVRSDLADLQERTQKLMTERRRLLESVMAGAFTEALARDTAVRGRLMAPAWLPQPDLPESEDFLDRARELVNPKVLPPDRSL